MVIPFVINLTKQTNKYYRNRRLKICRTRHCLNAFETSRYWFFLFLTVTLQNIWTWNKRAQRALGRSPEEKVKGHRGAIYRGPLMLYTKYKGSSRFLQEDFLDFPKLLYINQICPPGRAPFYTRGIIWTFFQATNQNYFNNFGRGPGIIPVEFGQISISGSRDKVVWGRS